MRSSLKALLGSILPAVAGIGVAVMAVVSSGTGPSPSWVIGSVLLGLAVAAGAAWLEQRVAARVKTQREAKIRRDTDAKVARISAERQKLEAVVNGMAEGVLVTDALSRVTLANPRWRELFGLGESIVGLAVSELVPEPRVSRLVNTVLASGEPRQLELELDDPERSLILTAARLGEGGGAVVVARDISEFLRMTEIRRDFVANVSHELKTPLSAIRGFAETLADGGKDDPNAAEEFLERILRQCSRLEALLSDLLTLSRLEHSEGQSQMTSIDLGQILCEAVEEVRERAGHRRVVVELEQNSSPVLEGDALALERLCANLLDNAVKYNREGGSVRVRLLQAGSEVVLEVEDSGIGIPKTSIDRLFERFYRVDKGRSRGEGGTGLGLAIVKHAAGLHGGEVEVQSELGKGSLFSVRLPSSPVRG